MGELIIIFENLYDKYGLPIVFLSGLFEMSPLGWLVPGGALISIAGFFSYGSIEVLTLIVLTSWLGSWLSFFVAYYLGTVTSAAFVRKLHQETLAKKAKLLLKKHGGKIFPSSMLAGLTRFWISYAAGSSRYKLTHFGIFAGIASLIWSLLMVSAGYLAGTHRGELEKGIARLSIIGWVFLAIAIGTILYTNRLEKKELEVTKEK